jgi:glycosyltransferase involved in cell wall biosynthesis
MNNEWVTVVCLCYNHARFVREAISSVYQQTYPLVQLIVVDDASTDESVNVILSSLFGGNTFFLPLQKNQGICKAFNMALAHARGRYVIDLAADDVLLPKRIETQVKLFQSLDNTYGIVFGNAIYIDAQGKHLRQHTEHLINKGLILKVPEGNVFADVLRRYFICSPTMMIRREVLDELHGYDETLAYEDFDLWVRASRKFKFAYDPAILTLVRKLSGSMSAGLYEKDNLQLHSTYQICVKAKQMIQSQEEKIALIGRVRYELRQAVFSEKVREAGLFFDLLAELGDRYFLNVILKKISRLNLPLAHWRKWYQRMRYS